MSYAGLTGRPEANHLPLSKLVEGRVCYDVHFIEREGLLLEGADGALRIPARTGEMITRGFPELGPFRTEKYFSFCKREASARGPGNTYTTPP